MKSSTFVATLTLIIFIQIINGQHNGLVFNENFETIIPELQQPRRTYKMANTVQDVLNQNENTAQSPNNVNQYQILKQTSAQLSSPSPQQIQLPQELQQQPLQVQQYLQLQKPLQTQQPPCLQQALQLQPEMQVQPLLQHPLQIEAQPPSLQDSLNLQQQIQVQPQYQLQIPQALQTQQSLLPEQPIQVQQLFQLQQPLQSQQPNQKNQPLNFQQPIKSQESLPPQPIQLQQPLRYSQISPQIQPITTSENKLLVETPVTAQRMHNQPNSQIHVKWKPSDPSNVVNTDNFYNTQNLSNQPQQHFINRPVEAIVNALKSNSKTQEVPSLTYYVVSQQPSPQPLSSISAPVVSQYNSIAAVSSNYMKPAEQTQVSITTPYNYITPVSEFLYSVPERTNYLNSVPVSSPVLTIPSIPIPSIPIQSTTTQSHYYTQRAADFRQTPGFNYPEQYPLPVTILQSQPTVSVPSQSILSPVPISISQLSSASPQYGVSSSYPVNTIVAPAYTTRKPKSSNLKSILPLIFNLLKERIASCSCKNDCPCECKNNCSQNQLEMSNGYLNGKDYGPFNNDGLSVLDNVSEEAEGLECLRETKNCDKLEDVSEEVCDETLEEEDTVEEDFDEDEDS